MRMSINASTENFFGGEEWDKLISIKIDSSALHFLFKQQLIRNEKPVLP